MGGRIGARDRLSRSVVFRLPGGLGTIVLGDGKLPGVAEPGDSGQALPGRLEGLVTKIHPPRGRMREKGFWKELADRWRKEG